jgi:hypothetical protein
MKRGRKPGTGKGISIGPTRADSYAAKAHMLAVGERYYVEAQDDHATTTAARLNLMVNFKQPLYLKGKRFSIYTITGVIHRRLDDNIRRLVCVERVN